MASAEQEVTTKTIVTGIKLTLTPDEAQFLADLVAHVGGNAERTRKKYASNISRALHEVGVTWEWPTYDMAGAVECLDE